MFSKELYLKNLHTNILGHNFIYKPKTNSTNEDAWKYSTNKNSDGSIILTDNQTRGKGRRTNKWISSINSSLTFSFILYPQIKIDHLGLLPLLAGVSIVRGVFSSTGIATGLKWPNDIMLNEKKMGGILIESKKDKKDIIIIVGIGLNINETISDFPETIKKESISLNVFTKQIHSREKILSSILNEFEILYDNNFDSIIPMWKQYCIHMNNEISFNSDNSQLKGIFAGISNHGHAKINLNGRVQTFPSGVVTL